MQNTDIAPGSTIAITGVNGYIGSNIANELLHRGYNVRGTVRDTKRCDWMNGFFAERYGPKRFSLVEITDLADEASYDAALSGASSLLITTSVGSFTVTDPDTYIPLAVEQILAPLAAAARHHETVKSVVYTGSAWSVGTPQANVKAIFDEKSWNEAAVAEAYEPEYTDPTARGVAVFMAGMVKKEQEAWKWVRDHKPSFRFNVVLVSTVFGTIQSTEHQGLPTTAGFLSMAFTGQNIDVARMYVKPQWFVDVDDVARLHVAATLRGDVNGERIFAFGAPFGWNDVLAVSRRAYPDRTFVEDDEEEGKCLTGVPNRRGEQLLKEMGKDGWTGLEESVKKCVESAKLALTA